MRARRIFLLSYMAFTCHSIHAQQEMLYTQYFFAPMAINPATAGNDDDLSLTGLTRKQWMGLDGAPTTFSFIGHTSIVNQSSDCRTTSGDGRALTPVKNKQIGFGLVLFNNRVGVTNTFQSSLAYSYKIKFKPGTRLSFGLQVGLLSLNQLYNQLGNYNVSDPVFQDNIHALQYNAGAGVFFETSRFFVGLSVPEIMKNTVTSNIYKQILNRQYFLSTGYVFYLNRMFKFKPTMLVRYIEGMVPQFDVNANILYKDLLWFGLAYRYNNSVNVITELLATKNLKIGLSYDYGVSEINIATQGSVEILVNYVFHKAKKKVINPRYF